MFRGADAVQLGGRQHRRPRFREWSAGPARSENLCMRGISMRENREARWPPACVVDGWAGRVGKASGRKPTMNGRRESDSRVVPAKLANKAGRPVAEPVEGRRLDKGTRTSKTRSGLRAGKLARQV